MNETNHFEKENIRNQEQVLNNNNTIQKKTDLNNPLSSSPYSWASWDQSSLSKQEQAGSHPSLNANNVRLALQSLYGEDGGDVDDEDEANSSSFKTQMKNKNVVHNNKNTINTILFGRSAIHNNDGESSNSSIEFSLSDIVDDTTDDDDTDDDTNNYDTKHNEQHHQQQYLHDDNQNNDKYYYCPTELRLNRVNQHSDYSSASNTTDLNDNENDNNRKKDDFAMKTKTGNSTTTAFHNPVHTNNISQISNYTTTTNNTTTNNIELQQRNKNEQKLLLPPEMKKTQIITPASFFQSGLYGQQQKQQHQQQRQSNSTLSTTCITIGTNTSSSEFEQRMQRIQNENNVLRQELNELIQTRGGSDKKHQVQFNSMRQVMEKIQMEADDTISLIKKETSQDLHEKENILKGWKGGFQSLLQQLFHWNELGFLCSTTDNKLNERILASIKNDHVPEIVQVEMKELLQSLSSIQHHQYQSVGIQTEEEDYNDIKKTTSIAVDTSDLSTLVEKVNKEKILSEVQLENASLRGTNEHLTDQMERYRKQIQALKEKESRISFSSPSTKMTNTTTAATTATTTSSTTPQLFKFQQDDMDEELSQISTKLYKELLRLKNSTTPQQQYNNELQYQEIQVLQDENQRVVKRCIELEHVAEEATKQCEQMGIDYEGKASLFTNEREQFIKDYDNEKQEYQQTFRRNQEVLLRDTSKQIEIMKEEQKNILHTLQKKVDGLEEEKMERKKGMDMKLKLLRDEYDGLVFESQKIKDESTGLVQQVQVLQNERGQLWNEKHNYENNYKTLEEKVAKEEQKSLVLMECKSNLEDECVRLKNRIVLMQTKMEEGESNQLLILREKYDTSTREASKLKNLLDSIKEENISLADGKTNAELECSRLKKECETLHESLDSAIQDGIRSKEVIDILQQKEKDQLHSLELEKTNAEKIHREAKEKIDLIKIECNTLKASKESLQSEVNNLNEKICFINNNRTLGSQANSDSQYQQEQQEIQGNTPKIPSYETNHETTTRISKMPIQTPAFFESTSNTLSSRQNTNCIHTTESKSGLSAVCSCLFEKRIDLALEKKSDLKSRTAVVQQTSYISNQSMDDRLERLKFADHQAFQKLRHASSSSSLRTMRHNNRNCVLLSPFILKPAVKLSTAERINSRNKKTSASVSSNTSLQETEAFVLDILKSCKKSTL